MRRIVLDMQCELFAEAICQTLKNSDLDFLVRRAEGPDQTVKLCRTGRPYALLMEVTNYTPWKLEERLRIRDMVKASVPECKVVLLVDEKADKALADRVRQAKKDGLVDNFIYGSISPEYFSAVMDAL